MEPVILTERHKHFELQFLVLFFNENDSTDKEDYGPMRIKVRRNALHLNVLI